MKKVLILIFVAVSLGACKKSEVVLFNETLKGTWELSFNELKYYNESDELIYEETLTGDDVLDEVTFSGNTHVNLLLNGGESFNSGYDLYKRDEVSFLQFMNVFVFESQVFEITSSDENDMTWQTQYSEVDFEDDQELSNTADYAILTLKFQKKR